MVKVKDEGGMMKDEFRSILISIVEFSKRASKQDSISLTYLVNKLPSTRQNLESILTLLEREGLITINKPTTKVTLIQPTIKGYEKALEWQESKKAQTSKGKLFSFGKVLGFSLFAVILGIAWWWLGFSTKRIEPLTTQIAPFKVYNQTIREDAKSFYDVLNETLETGETANPDGSIPATLDGKINISFEIESNAENHQINIHSVDVEIIREENTDIVDLWHYFIGLGGGSPWEYEVPLDPSKPLPDGIPVIVRAELEKSSNAEYIYLKPGDREYLRMVLNLPKPGRYKLTPIINYTFQDNNSAQRIGTSVVYFPEKFRYSSIYYDENSQKSTLPGPIILDTQTKSFTLSESYKYNKNNCVNLDKWIAFIAQVSWGDGRLFVLNPTSGIMDMLSDHTKFVDILGWDLSNNLYYAENVYDYKSESTTTEIKIWDPNQGARLASSQNTPQSLYSFRNNDNRCLNSGLCLEAAQQDTNGDGIINFQDVNQIVLVDSNKSIRSRLGFSNQNQSDPIFSPDKNFIVYSEGNGCNPQNPGHLFVLNATTLASQQITSIPGSILSPIWSPDGQKIAFATNGNIDSFGNISCKDDYFQVHIIEIKSGMEIKIDSGISQDTVFGWSADSNWLLVGGHQISLVSQDGTCIQPILPRLAIDEYIPFEPFAQGIIQP